MFIDDTGDVDNAATNQAERRFASITGVILEWNYLTKVFQPGLDKLSEKHFGLNRHNKPHCLHRRRMIKGDGPFICLNKAGAREAWDKDCLSMFDRAKFTVVTTCVDKIAFYQKHAGWNGEIYELLVGNAVERYFYFLRATGGVGDVMAEAVDKGKDGLLKEYYARTYANGTGYIPSQNIRSVLTSKEIKIKPKTAGEQGLQLADLIAKPCFSQCRLIYTGHDERTPFAAIVGELIEAKKFYRDPKGNPDRYGRVWRP